MSLLGKVPEFKSEDEEWIQYVERLDFYFIANKHIIKDDEDQKRAVLLNGVGAKTYNLVRNLVSPAKPSDKSYKEICQLVQAHHNPMPSEIVERLGLIPE